MYENFVQPAIIYCESNLNLCITQPANAWTNLFFVFIGIYIFFRSRKHKNPILKLLGPIVILIGIFSFFYHATSGFAGQFMDSGSMYFFSALLIILNIHRLNTRFFTPKKLYIIFLLLVSASLWTTFSIRTINGINIGIPIFAIQLLTVLLLEWELHSRSTHPYKVFNLLMALAVFSFAFAIWILDFLRMRMVGDPKFLHIINGHSTWHILNGIALIFIFHFYADLKGKRGTIK